MTESKRKTFTNGLAKNWQELATEIGASRQILAKWRKLEGAPEEPNVEEWRDFMAERSLGRLPTAKLTEIRAEIEREKLRKIRRENEVAEGRIIPVETMNTINGELAAKLALLLKVKFVTELPSLCVGSSITEIRAIAQQKIDEVSDVTTRGLLDWESGGK